MSSLKDLASLIMVPSLYKDGELHTVKPLADENIIVHPDATDNNDGVDGTTTPSTSSNLTFSRGSNLAATRVDVNGLIEKGRENRFLQSNNFTTSWTLSAASITSGHSGYDGTNNAWELIESATTAEHLIRQTPSFGGVVTLSVYAKANTRDWLWLRGVTSGANIRAWFDLTNGVVGGTSGSVIDHNIVSAGGGWYRCSLTLNHDAAFEYYIGLSSADGSAGYAGDGSSSIYIQDAQLEAGLVATDYIETGASTAQSGILEDMPRLDYSGGASCPSLLLEPQRSNINPNGEYFEAWNRVNNAVAVLTANEYTSPEGKQNAYEVEFTASGGSSQIYKVLNGFTIGTKYTSSIYVKYISGSGADFQIVKSFGTAGVRCTFSNAGADLSVIAVGGTQANDFGKEPLENGWFRIWFTYASNTTNWEINISRQTGSGSDVYGIYGFQLEAGSYPTSYIPTYGTSVTRSQEGAQVTSVSDLIGQTQGTLFAEVDSFGVGEVANRILGISDGGMTMRVIMLTRSYGFRFIVTNSSSNSVDYTYSTTTDGVHKLAMTYDANEVRIFVDGTKVTTDTSITLPTPLNSIHIGKLEQSGSYANNFGGSVKQSVVFPTALTDSECIALTTL